MATHHFETRLRWRRDTEGAAAGTHAVEFEGKPSLEVSAAPQYRGDASRPNPEELFVSALASCQLLAYLALARRAGVEVVAYEDRPVGTLAIADRRMRVTDVLLRPRITVAAGTGEEQARALVDRAHESCFIAASVSCAVRLEAEVVVAV